MAEKRTLTDPLSDVNNSSDSSTPSDSTYNLEDHISPPVITPLQLSGSGTDSVDEVESEMSDIIPSYLFQIDDLIIPPYLFQIYTAARARNMEYNRCLLLDIDISPSTSLCVQLSQSGIDSMVESESDISEIIPPYLFDIPFDYIIPPYLFEIHSNTRATNMEYNRCLLLDIDPLPSTSGFVFTSEHIQNEISSMRIAAPNSTSESSSKCKKINKRVQFALQEINFEDDSVSTDYECTTNTSSKTHSSTIDSTDEDVQEMPDTLTLTSISTFSLSDSESILNTDRSDLGLNHLFGMFSPRVVNEDIEAPDFESVEQIIPAFLFM